MDPVVLAFALGTSTLLVLLVVFSPMGAQRREQGPSMLCLYVWARALREAALFLAIIEDVPRFPISLLESLFGDMSAIAWAMLDALDFGAPAR